jgi:hypothetical protein
VDVLLAETVFVAVLPKTLRGIDHEDAFASLGVLLVHEDDAGWDAGAVKEIRGQADDAFDDAALDEIPADDAFGIPAKEDAVRENARAFASALQRTDDVQQIGVVALSRGRDAVMLEAMEGIVRRIEPGAPALVAERRIGGDVVESLEGVALGEKRSGESVALISAVA